MKEYSLKNVFTIEFAVKEADMLVSHSQEEATLLFF